MMLATLLILAMPLQISVPLKMDLGAREKLSPVYLGVTTLALSKQVPSFLRSKDPGWYGAFQLGPNSKYAIRIEEASTGERIWVDLDHNGEFIADEELKVTTTGGQRSSMSETDVAQTQVWLGGEGLETYGFKITHALKSDYLLLYPSSAMMGVLQIDGAERAVRVLSKNSMPSPIEISADQRYSEPVASPETVQIDLDGNGQIDLEKESWPLGKEVIPLLGKKFTATLDLKKSQLLLKAP